MRCSSSSSINNATCKGLAKRPPSGLDACAAKRARRLDGLTFTALSVLSLQDAEGEVTFFLGRDGRHILRSMFTPAFLRQTKPHACRHVRDYIASCIGASTRMST
jgi:hypothetical protein